MVSSLQMEQPVSRTDQYKRVMKPLLERKRRARINRCLDELRDLLVAALQAEGETVTRLEKADILELTVRHVRRLNQRRRLTIPSAGGPASTDPRQDAVKFQQGFLAAAQQVQSFLLSTPSLEPAASSRLLVHLSTCASAITSGPLSPPNHHELPPPTSADQMASSSPRVGGGPAMTSTPLPSPSAISPPPPLIDLSAKPAHHSQHHPVPHLNHSRLVAPTPIRKEPIVFKDPYPVGPQDLSIRRGSPPESDSKDAWRPW